MMTASSWVSGDDYAGSGVDFIGRCVWIGRLWFRETCSLGKQKNEIISFALILRVVNIPRVIWDQVRASWDSIPGASLGFKYVTWRRGGVLFVSDVGFKNAKGSKRRKRGIPGLNFISCICQVLIKCLLTCRYHGEGVGHRDTNSIATTTVRKITMASNSRGFQTC